jgi:hypothetical protein
MRRSGTARGGIVARFVPGHGGPGPAEGHGVGETQIRDAGTRDTRAFTSVPLAVASASGQAQR